MLVTDVAAGGESASLIPQAPFRPGMYHVVLSLTPSHGVRNLVAEFFGGNELTLFDGSLPIGLFTMNADSNAYAVGDHATVAFGLADATGKPLCEADITLTVTRPDGSTVTLGTEDGGIDRHVGCLPQSPMHPADADVTLTLKQAGTYHLVARAVTPEGERITSLLLAVMNPEPDVRIARSTVNRTMPNSAQDMHITITPSVSFVGTVTDTVPAGFTVSDASTGGEVQRSGDSTAVAWTRAFTAGVPVMLRYSFRAPAAKPLHAVFGPLSVRGDRTGFEPEPFSSVMSAPPVVITRPEEETSADADTGLSTSADTSSVADPEMTVVPTDTESAPANAPQESAKSSATTESMKSGTGVSLFDRIERRFASLVTATLRVEPAEAQSTLRVSVDEYRSWELLSLTAPDRPLQDTTTTLTLDPISDEVVPSGTPAAFTLLHVNLTGSNLLDSRGHLKDSAALAAIAAAVTSRDDLTRAVVQTILQDSAADVAEAVSQDSVAAGTIEHASDATVSMSRRDVMIRQAVLGAFRKDTVQQEIAQAVAESPAVAAVADQLITDDLRQAVMTAAAADPATIPSALKSALAKENPQAVDVLHDAVLDSVKVQTQTIADAVTNQNGSIAQTSRPLIEVTMTAKNGRRFTPDFHFQKGSVVLVVEPERSFAPGLYTIEVTVTSPLTGESQTLTQDFAWGVLAMNTNQDRYEPGDAARIDMGVLDDSGEIVCSADLTLAITSPSGEVATLSTQDSSIQTTGTCGKKQPGFIEPDFQTYFTLLESGVYRLALTAATPNGSHTINSTINVGNVAPVTVSRTAATRLWPFALSPMTIGVTFHEDFTGTIRDSVPEGFIVKNVSGGGNVSKLKQLPDGSGSGHTIAWNGSWHAGEKATFTYDYDAPDISPQFYLMGPLTLSGDRKADYAEARTWQIANDPGSLSVTGKVYSDANGTVPLSGVTVAVSVNAAAATTTAVDAGGQFTVNGLTLTGGSIITMWIDGHATHKAVTVSLGSGSSMTGFTLIKDSLIVRSGTGAGYSPVVTSHHLSIATRSNSSDADISAIFTKSSDNITVPSGKRMTLWNTGSILSMSGTLTADRLHLQRGTLRQGSNAFTINTAYTQSGGMFAGSSGGSAITITGTYSLRGGTFISTSGTLTITNSGPTATLFTVGVGGTFTHNSGTVNFTGGDTSGSIYSMSLGQALNFNNLTVNFRVDYSSATLNVPNGQTVNVLGTLTQSAGYLTGTYNLYGNLVIGSATVGGGSGIINFTGSSPQTYTSGGGRSAGITINNSNGVTPASGTTSLYIVNGTFNLNSGSFTAPSGTLTISGVATGNYFTVATGTTFTHNAGTVMFVGGDTSGPIFSFSLGQTLNLYNVTINPRGDYGSATVNIPSGQTLNVLGTLTHSVGYITGTWNAKGNVVISSTLGGTAALTFSGTGSQLLDRKGTVTTGTWTIAKPTGTVTLSGALSLNTSGQDLTLTGGTLNLNGYNLAVNDQFTVGTGTTLRLHGNETLTGGPDYLQQNSTVWYDESSATKVIRTFTPAYQNLVISSTGSAVYRPQTSGLGLKGNLTISGGTLQVNGGQPISLSGSWLRSGNGTFSAGTGTVTLSGTSAGKTIIGATTFNNLTAGRAGVWTVSGSTQTIGGTLTVNAGQLVVGSNAGLVTTGIGTNVSIGASGKLSNSGTLTLAGAASPISNAGVWNNAPASHVYLTGTAGDAAVTVPSATYGNLHINNTGSTFTLGANLSANGRIALDAGTLDISGSNFTISAAGWSDTAAGDQFNERSGTVIFSGSGTVATNEPFRNVSFTTANAVHTLASTLSASGTLSVVGGTTAQGAYAVTASGFIVQGGTFSGGGALTVQHNATMTGGTLTAPSGPFRVSGNWLKKSAATFTPGTSTVTLNGTNQTVSGSTTFYNFTKSITSADTLNFAATTTQTVTNALTLNGAAGNRLSLRSTQTGTQWKIDPQGTRTVSYLDVKDSNNLNASPVNCSTGCANSSNNTNWSFPVQGTVYTDAGVTAIGASRTVAVSINGSAATTGATDSSGNFSINPGTVHTGDVLTIYLQGNAEKGVTVSVNHGTSLSGFQIFQNTLVIRNDNGGSTTNANLSTAAGNGDSGISAIYTIAGNSLTMTAGKTLYVLAGHTFAPGGPVNAVHVTNAGTFTMGSNAVSVSGNWTNTGAVTGSNTVTFTGTGASTITSGGSAFATIALSKSGATVMAGDSLAVNSSLTINTGATLDMHGKGLTVSGTFTNNDTLKMLGSETTSLTNDAARGTTIFTGTGTYPSLAGLTSFHNLTFSAAGTWSLGASTTVSRTLTITAGTLKENGKSLSVGGDWSDSGTFSGTGTVTFTGDGTITEPRRFSSLTVRGTNATVTLGSALNVSGSLLIQRGLLAMANRNVTASGFLLGGGDLSGGAATLTVQHDLTMTGGTLTAPSLLRVGGNWLRKSASTFVANSGTVTLNGTQQTLSGSTTFYNLSKSGGSGYTLTFARGTTQTVAGTWTAVGQNGGNLRLVSSQNGGQWYIDPQSVRTLQYIIPIDSNNANATTILCSNDCTNGGGNTNWAFPITVTVYTDSGTTLAGAGVTVAVAVNGVAGTKATAVTNAQGVATFTSTSVSSSDILTAWLDDGATQGVSITKTNGTTLGFQIYADTLQLSQEAGTRITSSDVGTGTLLNDADINDLVTYQYTSGSGHYLTMPDFSTLRIKTGSNFEATGNASLYNVDINGTLTMGTWDMTVRGSWDATGGSFSGDNNVTFQTDRPQSITSNGSSFHDVTFAIPHEGALGTWVTTDQISITSTQTINITSDVSSFSGPQISNISVTANDAAAVVRWNTSQTASSRLLYGTNSGALANELTDANLDYEHTLDLSSLTPSTTYYYRIIATNNIGQTTTGSVFSFNTLSKQLTQVDVDNAASSAAATAMAASQSSTARQSGGGGGGSDRNCARARITMNDVKVTPNPDQGTADVTWRTNSKALSLVQFGKESLQEHGMSDPINYVTDHSLTLAGIAPSVDYRLKAYAIDACGNVASSDELTFRSGSGSVSQLLDQLHGAATDSESIKRALALLSSLTSSMTVSEQKKTLLAQTESIRDLANAIPGPILSGEPRVIVTDTSATINWVSDEPSNSLVDFSPDDGFTLGAYASTIGDPEADSVAHQVTLIELTPNKTYHYRVKSATKFGTQTLSHDYTFKTLAQSAEVKAYSIDVLSPSSASFMWETNVPADGRIVLTPYKGGKLLSGQSITLSEHAIGFAHRIVADAIEGGTVYQVELSGKTAGGTVVTKTIPSFATTKQILAPQIARIQTDASLSPGKDTRIQVVVSWATDKRSTSSVHYQKGVATDGDAAIATQTPADPSYVLKHAVILGGLDPGTVYSFQVESMDDQDHSTTSKIFTILTPRVQASVFQVITQEFGKAFGWLGNLAL